MKKTIILLFLVLAVITAYAQTPEFRYNGAADVIFSYPQHGSGGRAFVHEGNNVLTINYAGDFSNGVKIGNYLWIANDGTLITLGNVGIGTTTPKAKLSVNGNILATEIKIKTNIEVPDYVFDPSYQLPKLAAIEDYVKKHRHLPEIPSAAEIQKEGVDLTQMNLSLLKKVEELTLHLIEKEKEIEKLKINQEAGFLELSKRLDRMEK
ncbi:hypothetical protein [Sphingobacterium anhuiense]|uniref:Uncharacterized protein n=1 Tax=Sphingobacterium anhuiense TaxID=493780 RepID=A0ABW5YY01_9SPHI